MDAWGIKFSGSALIWVKVNRDGSIWKSSGYSFRRNCEIAWLGRIGSPRRAARDVSELIIAPRGRHSSKPREQYFRIERLVGPGRVLVELFARGSGPPAHWHAAGDELELDAAPTTTVNEVSTLIYDPVADVWRGVAEANSGIRKRKAAGSDGWNPR
jgi:N6-adenosine-specific RNA methylase IME4